MTVRILKPHVAINVKDVPASIEFYRKLFGADPAKVRTGYAKFDVSNPPLNFTLNEHSFDDAGALSHLGLQVSSTEEVYALRQEWHARGLTTRDEMQTNCCFATQDKAWVKDPDGNEWEVFVVLRDNLPEEATEPDVACCGPSCCDDHSDVAAGASCGCVTAGRD